ncbi:MAG TPA: hypothetical protein VKQ09_02260, partial [Sphingomonas sp.]|nr:hypothetical protein [Sphingomonas sp.]
MSSRIPAGHRCWPLPSLLLCHLALLGAAGAATAAPAPSAHHLPDAASFADMSGPIVATPADIYGPLFRAVQLARVFPDSKTFADAVPRRDPGQILADYRTAQPIGAG